MSTYVRESHLDISHDPISCSAPFLYAQARGGKGGVWNRLAQRANSFVCVGAHAYVCGITECLLMNSVLSECIIVAE